MARAEKAKAFMSGRSQAVRIPAEYRFITDEVYIRRDHSKWRPDSVGAAGRVSGPLRTSKWRSGVPLVDRITERSIKFSSSRMWPGQSSGRDYF
jgi:hypothetical protein